MRPFNAVHRLISAKELSISLNYSTLDQ